MKGLSPLSIDTSRMFHLRIFNIVIPWSTSSFYKTFNYILALGPLKSRTVSVNKVFRHKRKVVGRF